MEEVIVSKDQAHNLIVVPEGQLAAPGDYEIIRKTLEINGRQQTLELIRQTYEGNCAEYTSLNAALLLRMAGMSINPATKEYLNNNRQLNVAAVENEFVIPLLLRAQESYASLQSTVTDADNLGEKLANPYVPLTNINSALLFRTVISPIHKEFSADEVVRGNPDKALDRVSSQETIAVFIGSGNHATCWIKLGEDCYHIDPYYTVGVVRKASIDDMKNDMRRSLSLPGSFATLNDVYTI